MAETAVQEGGAAPLQPFGEDLPGGYVNQFNPPSQIAEALENVRRACTSGYPVLDKPFPEHDGQLCIVAGGPSINGCVDELKALVRDGATVACVNNAHDWLLSHGIEPHFMIFMEVGVLPRMFKRVLPHCTYLIPSHSHETTFQMCEGGNIMLWHAYIGIDEMERVIRESHPEPMIVPGASRGALRAFNLGMALGYREFHGFGFDSCFPDDGASHAYEDREIEHRADLERVIVVANRVFKTNVGWARQADEFRRCIKWWDGALKIRMYGDGLIQWIHRVMEPRRYAD